MTQTPDSNEQEMPFLQHLFEMRDRLLRVVLVILVLFLGLFAFKEQIYGYISEPLTRYLTAHGGQMVATQPMSTFLAPMKLALVLAFFISIPHTLYQVWAFVAPGLYKHERKLIYPLLISSVVLFYAGMAFAYYVVMPLMFQFLTGISIPETIMMTDISPYLDLVLKIFFAFGLAFEIPIATILMVWTGMTTPESLSNKRPYIVVACFVIGMLLTPPDMISQTMLAVPMWLLFELGVFFSRVFYSKRDDDDETDEDSDQDDDGDNIIHSGPGEDGGPNQPPSQPINPESAGVAADSPSTNAQGSTAKNEAVDDSLVFADDEMNDWKPMTQEEMDDELDRMENEDNGPQGSTDKETDGDTPEITKDKE